MENGTLAPEPDYLSTAQRREIGRDVERLIERIEVDLRGVRALIPAIAPAAAPMVEPPASTNVIKPCTKCGRALITREQQGVFPEYCSSCDHCISCGRDTSGLITGWATDENGTFAAGPTCEQCYTVEDARPCAYCGNPGVGIGDPWHENCAIAAARARAK